tara:strand:+ start:1183 stop:1332 length:150 start_codon:yes stop_codon:yes gene_type:complete
MWVVRKTIQDVEHEGVECQYLTDMLDAVKRAAVNDLKPISIAVLYMEDD